MVDPQANSTNTLGSGRCSMATITRTSGPLVDCIGAITHVASLGAAATMAVVCGLVSTVFMILQ